MTINSYIDKYKGVDGRLSVMDILQKVGTTEYKNGEKREYEAVDIDYVKIDGNKFTNYGAYQFIWEKTFVKSPSRSTGGNIGNINSYPTFLTPHLIIDFSVMSIDDYRKIMTMHYERNEFEVECYDPIYNKRITVKMYFATEEMAKLYTISQNRLLPNGKWEDWVDLVGVTEYKVELIGTNNELDLASVRYEYSQNDDDGKPLYPSLPNGSPATPEYEEDIYLGEEISVGTNSTFKSNPPANNLKFKHWVDDNGKIYKDGAIITINTSMVFYAVWESVTSYTLSFDYGISDVATKVENGIETKITSIDVQTGHSIGTLPTLTPSPSVVDRFDGKKYYPYVSPHWYRKTVRDLSTDNRVSDNQIYWADRNVTIYALYDRQIYVVTYYTNDPNINISLSGVAYGDAVPLPNLYREGYTFKGWYIDSGFNTKFSGTMTPYDLDLYAKWEGKQ